MSIESLEESSGSQEADFAVRQDTYVRAFALIVAVMCFVLFVLINLKVYWGKLGLTIEHPVLTAVGSAFVTFCLVLATAYSVEVYFIGFQRSSFRMLLKWDRQIRYDLFYALLPWTPIYATVTYWMTLGIDRVNQPIIPYVKDGFSLASLAFPIQLVAFQLIWSFLVYWQRRAFHMIPIFWETHKFHHSAEQMTTLSFMRETPFTAALTTAFTAAPAAAFGTMVFPASPTAADYVIAAIYACYISFAALNEYLQHSNLTLTYGWVGRYFVASPANHRVHHSILPEHLNKNFSASWVLWDRIFGTYHEGADPVAQTCPVGYDGNIYNKNKWIVVEYLYPMIGFYGAIYVTLRRYLRKLLSAGDAWFNNRTSSRH